MRLLRTILLVINVFSMRALAMTDFDFISALRAGDIAIVRRCIADGKIDINMRLGKNLETPLMLAVRMIDYQYYDQETISWHLAKVGVSALTLGVGAVLAKNVKRIVTWFCRGSVNSVVAAWRSRQWGTLGKTCAFETVNAALFLFISLFVVASLYESGKTFARNSAKVLYAPLHYYKMSNRMMILSELLKHPDIDLSLKNTDGKTASDLVHELVRHYDRVGYIAELLKPLEQLMRA